MKFIELNIAEYAAQCISETIMRAELKPTQKIICVNIDAIVSFEDKAVRTIDGGLILCDETMAEIKDKLRHI